MEKIPHILDGEVSKMVRVVCFCCETSWVQIAAFPLISYANWTGHFPSSVPQFSHV